MMLRIIPRLDIKGPNLVKGIHLEGLRVLGKPEEFAKLYYNDGADEIFFQDTVASLYERNNLSNIIEKTSHEIFIPITVGGGIRTLSDINEVLRAGADKVAINTACVKNPNFIKIASEEFGSSTIVVSLEVIKKDNDNYFIYTDNGREHTGINAIDWVQQVEHLGAGEIILTSIDCEGTGKGMDINLINMISNKINLPVIAHGGIGNIRHILDLLENSNVSAVSMASLLHYNAIEKFDFDENKFLEEGNTNFLSGYISKKPKFFEKADILDIKNKLNSKGFRTRN